jgi:hypothetical protein
VNMVLSMRCFKKLNNVFQGICVVYDILQLGNYGFKKAVPSTLSQVPVRIQVRLDPPHPLVCLNRRQNGAVLPMRPEN